jgi:TetR/AcrR family transcriptional repressor of nem operon
MPRDGTKTKERILDAAQTLILGHGYGATTVDKVIEEAGITKGAFFYHFDTKAELARAIIKRHVEADLALLDDLTAKAERLSRDPLQQLLIMVGLLIDAASEAVEAVPGCLIASFAYQKMEFDEETTEKLRHAFLTWRGRLSEKIRAVMETRKPKLPVNVDALADMATSCVEGAYIMSMVYGERTHMRAQLEQYRNYLELLFAET